MSTEPVHPLNLPDLPELELPPLEPTTPTVGGGSPLTEPDPFGSAGGFPPQKPKPPDPTIKATKSGEIERFFDKELLEIHQIQRHFLFSDEDLLEIHQIRRYFLFSDEDLLEIQQFWRDLVKIYSRFDRSSQISARSRPIQWNISTGDEISEPTMKPEIKPTPTWNLTDSNRMIRQLKWVDFGFDFYLHEKIGSSPGQAQTRPVDTPIHKHIHRIKETSENGQKQCNHAAI